MNTIQTYLDNLFDALPQTEEVLQIKDDLLLNMEEKTLELMKEGKTENEAIGTVISEFGNIDELKESFGISSKENNNTQDETLLKQKWTVSDVQEFLDNKKRATLFVAIGVFLCMLGGAVLVGSTDYSDFIGLPILIVLVAFAVGIFIYSHSISHQLEFHHEESYLSNEAIQYLAVYEKSQKRRSVIPTALGIMLFILSPLMIIIPSNAMHNDFENIFVSIMIMIIAVGIFLCIVFNDYKTGIDILLQRENYSPKAEKENKVLGSVAAVWWMTITAIYLAYSFITGNWGMSWIIWPVAGVLFGAISVIVSSFVKE